MQQKSKTRSCALPRRAALKGLGAIAVLPGLGALGCGADAAPRSADGDPALEPNDAGVDAAPQPAAPDAGSRMSAEAGAPSQPFDAGTRDASPTTTAPDGVAPETGPPAAGDAGVDAAIGPGDFDSAASCSLTTTDIEGPFLIEEEEVMGDASMVRSDLREGMHGCEFRFSFRLLDARRSCAPIAKAQVYIWHCNADGVYSGFNGQDPNKPYTGAAQRTPENTERFCRGIQFTNAEGIVSFTTVYPGWYAGRPIHVHLIARTNETAPRMITTQLYFPAAFTTEVHTTEPAYMARAAAIPAGSRNPPSGRPAMPTLKHTPGLVLGTLNVMVNGA